MKLTPRSPMTTVGPVLVTVVPPKTANVLAVPSGDAAKALFCIIPEAESISTDITK
ncbi:hypothetical protein QVH35_08485 [Candidatus Nitrosotenuis chungbukensis]|uniref:hypothetical protein n=1 Tax=Candidatus Nitrosotenuis chungbukensis TaxID=1353246 RepID=UPI002672118A|nr:hypothetical protein [Candidatus Nitrosotenuis chungbukensis]WKT57424.1 hypothetical protein QVH35_08485 [Candidatus Nitrosotenuis chungbukensis]